MVAWDSTITILINVSYLIRHCKKEEATIVVSLVSHWSTIIFWGLNLMVISCLIAQLILYVFFSLILKKNFFQEKLISKKKTLCDVVFVFSLPLSGSCENCSTIIFYYYMASAETSLAWQWRHYWRGRENQLQQQVGYLTHLHCFLRKRKAHASVAFRKNV